MFSLHTSILYHAFLPNLRGYFKNNTELKGRGIITKYMYVMIHYMSHLMYRNRNTAPHRMHMQ